MRLNEYVGLWFRYSLKQGNPLYFFKMLIQLYLLRSFLYSLNYCIKEVIKSKIFWRLNLKVLAYEAATAWNWVIPCNFSKHLPNCICFIYFSNFELLYQRGYQGQYFWTLNLKVLAYEAATAWNRGIHGKILKFLIRLYLVLLIGSKSLSEVDLLKLNEYAVL